MTINIGMPLLTPLPTVGGASWGGLGIQTFFASSGFEPPPPVHRSMYLYFLLKGSPKLSWRIERKTFFRNAKYGDYTLVSKDFEIRDLCIDGDQEGLAIKIPCEKVHEWMQDDRSGKSTSLTSFAPFLYGEDPYLLNMALLMKDEISRGCPSGRIFAESMSLALLSYFYGKHRDKQPPMRGQGKGLSPAKLKLLDEYIHANLANNISLTELATLAQMSPSQLSRNFSMATGMPPYRYVLHARIDKAKTMLKSADRLITDVALDLGFASLSHFSIAFRKVTGTSPREFL
jgi:AraC-like DNA-binding protein